MVKRKVWGRQPVRVFEMGSRERKWGVRGRERERGFVEGWERN